MRDDSVWVRRDGSAFTSDRPIQQRTIAAQYELIRDAPCPRKRAALIALIVSGIHTCPVGLAILEEVEDEDGALVSGDTIVATWLLPHQNDANDLQPAVNLRVGLAGDEIGDLTLQCWVGSTRAAFDVLDAVSRFAQTLKVGEATPSVGPSSWDRLVADEDGT